MYLPPLQLAPLTSESYLLPSKVIQNLVKSTRAIVDRGWYVAPSQQKVVFREAQATARRLTASASQLIKPAFRRRYDATTIMVHNQTPLTVGHAWYQRGYRVAIVNPTPLRLCHTSLVNSVAEHNMLLRSGGLAECIVESGCYTLGHVHEPVVSPQLPIFRAHDGDLLDRPWSCDVITLQTDTIARVSTRDSVTQWLRVVMDAVRHVGANVLVFAIGDEADAPVLAHLLYNAFTHVQLHAVAAVNIVVADPSQSQHLWKPFEQRFAGMTISNN